MDNIKWKYACPLLTQEDVSKVEVALDRELPGDYKAIIQEHNGARPMPNAVDLSDGREVVFERLLRLEANGAGELEGYASSLMKRGHQSLLPFASDPFGNLFCFKYSGKVPKAVIFWNHEKNSTTAICGSFSDLLNSLHHPGEGIG